MKLRVLMYHSISADGTGDDLTVTKEQLEEHFQYLGSEGYSAISLSELVAYQERGTPLPSKPVLITFDDGFRNNYEIAYPLAQAYGMKVNFFLVPAFMLMGTYRNLPCLGITEVAQMDPSLVEVGLHSFTHQSYAELSPAQVEADIDLCRRYMDGLNIRWQPCLAYPYGAYPKRTGHRQSALFHVLDKHGIRLAFRIGNRLNGLPLRNRFLIQRCDIRGDESFRKFKWSLRLGKKWI